MLVVLDGIDGSGKTVIQQQVMTKLSDKLKVSTMDFPGYTKTLGGKLAGKMLNGDYGELAPDLAACIYALDRFQQKDMLEAKLRLHDVVLANRYTTSNLAYQMVRTQSLMEEKALLDFMYILEYEIYEIPKPDLVIVLDLPVDIALSHIAAKSKRDYTDATLDVYEKDVDFLKKVRTFYRYDLEKHLPSETRYYCLEQYRNGHVLAPEIVADQVCEIITANIRSTESV